MSVDTQDEVKGVPQGLTARPLGGPAPAAVKGVPEGLMGVPLTPQAGAPIPKLFPDTFSRKAPPEPTETMAIQGAKGLVEQGNLPIWNRPVVQNADGTHSSEYSTSFQDQNGHEVLVPTVVNGRFLTPDGKKPKQGSREEKAMFKEAWNHYLQTGENLGKFDNYQNADAYSEILHNRGARPGGTLPPAHTIPEGLSARPIQHGTLRAAHLSQWDLLKESLTQKSPDVRTARSNLDQFGQMMARMKQEFMNPLGMTDEEWAENKKEQQEMIEKHLGKTGWGGAAAGGTIGAMEFGEEMMSPFQIALMMGTFGESGLVQAARKIGIPGLTTAAKTLAKLAQLQFHAQMIEGTATGIENAAKAAWNGDWEAAAQNAIEGAASGYMAHAGVSHDIAMEKVKGDLNATATQAYGTTFEKLNPYDQGLVIDQMVKAHPDYQELIKKADDQQEQGKKDTKKQRQKRLSAYYSNAMAQAFNPDAAQRAVDGIARAQEIDEHHRSIQQILDSIRRNRVIQAEEDSDWAARHAEQDEAAEAERKGAAAEKRTERGKEAGEARAERDKLATDLRTERDRLYAERQEAQPEPTDTVQRHVEVGHNAEGDVIYPSNYWGEESNFGVGSDMAGYSIYRQTPRGVEWMGKNGNFSEEPDEMFNGDPETADTLARLSSLSASADTAADAEGATPEQKADAEKLAGIKRDLVNGEINAKQAQKAAGIAEKIRLADVHQAAQDGQLTGPYYEQSQRAFNEHFEKSLRDAATPASGWSEEDIQAVLDQNQVVARQETERNLNHVYRPGDYIVSKRGVKWTLDAKGRLHPDDGGQSVPLMRNGFYSNPAVQLAESGRIGYGTETREERRVREAKTRTLQNEVVRNQQELRQAMQLAQQQVGLQTAAEGDPRADAAEKEARQQRRMSRPPRIAESPESQIVRMIFQKPSDATSIINSLARSQETTPEEVMRQSLATDPAWSGTIEQKVAGLELGDKIQEEVRKQPWVVEKGKRGDLWLRSGNAQPVKLDRLNPTPLVKDIVERGKVEKELPANAPERVAFGSPHYTRWQQEQVEAVREIKAEPLPEPKNEKQVAVQAQAAKRRADAALSVATQAMVKAVHEPTSTDPEQVEKAVEKAQELEKTAEAAAGQEAAAEAKKVPEDAFPQRAPVSIGLKGDFGVMVQNGKEVPFHYELVPLEALVTSHEWHGKKMVENPRYPAALQPRTVSDSEAAQNALRAERGTYDFRQYADKTINGSMGPAIIDEGGQVVGGNTRLAILRKHIQMLEETPDVEEREAVMNGMKARMRQLAKESGIQRYPEDDKFHVVVRMMDKPIGSTREAAELGRLFNKKIGVEISESARGVSYSKALTPDVLSEIGRLVDAHDGLAAAISAEPDFFNNIVEQRFDVGPEEWQNWFREIGNDQQKYRLLSEQGRSQFTKALLGVFFKDSAVLNAVEGTTPYNAAERALAYLLKMQTLPERNITDKVVEAMQAAAMTKATDPGLSAKSDKWQATYAPSQTDFLGMEQDIPPQPDRMVETLWRAMQAGNRTLNDRLKSFIGEESSQALSMFGAGKAEVETPVEAFNRAFRKELEANSLIGGGPKELSPAEFNAMWRNEEPPEVKPETAKKVPEWVTEQRGNWFSPDRTTASSFGKSLKVVDVPADVASATDTGYQGRKEHVLPEVWSSKAVPEAEAGPLKEGMVRLYRGEAEKEKPKAEPKKGMSRPPKPKAPEQVAYENLAEKKGEKGFVTPQDLKTFLETHPSTKDHAAELMRTAKMMAEFVYDVDPPVGVDRKQALDWVLMERVAGLEAGELTTSRGSYSDPNIEAGFGDRILRLQKAADPTTFIHEFAHVIFPLLSDEDLKAIASMEGPRGPEWDGQRSTLRKDVYAAVSEKFAHGLERFLREENPTGFNSEVKAVLAKVKQIMRKVYLAAKSDPLSQFHNSEESRAVFAKMFHITDFDVADDWRKQVKEARAKEKRAIPKHPLQELASDLGAAKISRYMGGTVEDRVGKPVSPRNGLSYIFKDENTATAAFARWQPKKMGGAELVEGRDGEWGIRFNAGENVDPSILEQPPVQKHEGVTLEDMERELKEIPAHKMMQRRLLQLRIDNMKNLIRAQAGAEPLEPKKDPGLAKAVREEIKNGREQGTDRPGRTDDAVPRVQKPEGVRGISKPPMRRVSGDEAAGRGRPAEQPRALTEVTPVILQPLPNPRGEPVGTVKGEAFNQEKWVAGLKAAGLPENAPPPSWALDPKTAAVLKYPGQKEIVQLAMSALEQGDGFTLASATGTGKTYTLSAIDSEYRSTHPDAKILRITKNRHLVRDAKKVSANYFGVNVETDTPEDVKIEPGTTYATSYSNMMNNKIYSQIPWDLVLIDESGEARNWFRDENKVGKRLIEVANNSKKAVYASATPFHSPMEYGYLTKLALWPKSQFDNWISQNFAHEKKGDKIIARLDPGKQAKLREQLIERGQMVSQAISYDGFTAHFGVVPVTDAMKRSLDRIREGFARARDQFGRIGKPGMAQRVAAFEATYTKAWLERSRIPQAIELAKQGLAQGWHVMLFSETSADDLFRRERIAGEDPSTYQELDDAMGGQLSKIIPQFPDIYDTLREEFGDQIGDYSGRGNTDAAREAAKNDFLQGKLRMIYTTYAAGGIGVNLHDGDFPELNVKGGDKPRLAIYLGPPYSGVLLEQSIGRPWRFGVKSNVISVFLATDAAPDIHLLHTKVGPRLRALRAGVLGEKDSLAATMQGFTDAEKVRERQNMLAYSEGNEVEVRAQDYTVSSKSRDVGINTWDQIRFPPAADAKNKGMKYGTDVAGGDWSTLFQAKFGMRLPDPPENTAAKKIIDATANAIVSGKVPALDALHPADRQMVAGVAAASSTAAVDLNIDRDKDSVARMAMDANTREFALIPYQGITLSQEQGLMNIARMDRKADVGYNTKRMNRAFRADWEMRKAQDEMALLDALRRHKLEPTDEVMKEIWNVVEGKKVSADPKIMGFAADISDMMAIAHDDLAAVGEYVQTKEGRKTPYTDFPRDPHYMPHKVDYDAEMTDPLTGEKVTVRQFLHLDEKQQQRMLDAIPEVHGLTRKQVVDYLYRNDPRAPAQSHVRFAKEINFPFIKRDLPTLRNYFNQVAKSLAAAKHFGVDSLKLNEEIDKLDNPYSVGSMKSMFRASLEPQDWHGITSKLYRGALDYEALSKMTFSAVKVPFHLVLGPVALHGRVMPHIKAFGRLASHPREVMENAAYVGTVVNQLVAPEMEFGENVGAGARTILQRTGFEWAYRMVRTISGEAARVWMDQYALNDLKKGGRKAEEARRLLKDTMLVGDHGMDEAIRNGRFSDEDIARAQVAFTNQAAFSGSGDPMQMPQKARIETPRGTSYLLSGPNRIIRLTYALQSFSVKATSLLREHLFDEVVIHHNYKPLAYALTAIPILGTMMNLSGTGVKHGFKRGFEDLKERAENALFHAGLRRTPAHKIAPTPDSWTKYIAQLDDTFRHPTAGKFLKWYIDSATLSVGMEMVKTLADPLMNMAMGKPAKQDDYWRQDMLEHAIGPFFSDIVKVFEEEGNLQKIHEGKTHPELKHKKYMRSLMEFGAEEVPALREIPEYAEKIENKPKPKVYRY